MGNIIILDIGSQFVKAVIPEEKEVKEPLDENKEEAIERAIKKIQGKSNKAEAIFIGAGGEDLKGKTTTFCCKREEAGKEIDLTELKYLIQKVEWKALEEIRDEDFRLLDAFLVGVRIDNHLASNPIGVRGKNICLTAYNVYSSVGWLAGIEKIISKFNLQLAGLITNSYALFQRLDPEKLQKGSALIINIGGNITEVTLIKNSGEVMATKTFHLGEQIFSRTLAEFLGLKLNEAESIKTKYGNGKLSCEVKRKLEKLFFPAVSLWLNGITIVLEDFLEQYQSLPSKVFLCGEGSKLPIIRSALKKEKGIKIENKNYFNENNCSALIDFCAKRQKEGDLLLPVFKRVIKLIQSQ